MKDGSAATEDDAGGEFKVEVRRVVAGSVAADAGVMVGDTVAAINSFTLDSLGSNANVLECNSICCSFGVLEKPSLRAFGPMRLAG